MPQSIGSAQARRLLERVKHRLPTSWNHGFLEAQSLPPRQEAALRFLTLNLAHGRVKQLQGISTRKQTEDHLEVVGDVLRHAEADVVALQEADGPSSWSGEFDHVEQLATVAGLEHHLRGPHNSVGFGRFQFNWGTALLARHQLVDSDSLRFGQTWRDTKGFVVATIDVPAWGREIDVASVHLDFLAPRVRRRQIVQMAEALRERDRPLVLLGDLNCNWFQEPRSLELLMRELELRAFEPTAHRPTYPAGRPWVRLDWILVSRELDFGPVHGSLADRVSDHLAVVADIVPAGRP